MAMRVVNRFGPPAATAVEVEATVSPSKQEHVQSNKSFDDMVISITRQILTFLTYAVAQGSTVWWMVALFKLSYDRPHVSTLSIVIDDYAGIGYAYMWLTVAAVSEFFLFVMLVVYRSKNVMISIKKGIEVDKTTWYDSILAAVVINGLIFASAAGISVAYMWTISTLPAIGPVLKQHSKSLDGVWLQTVSFTSTIIFSAVATSWMHATDTQTQRLIFEQIQKA